MKVKALLFTNGEAGIWEPVPFELYKKDFKPEEYKRKRFKSYSEALQTVTNDPNIIINEKPVFALAFSDGTVWDTTHQWREGFGDKWSREQYNKLYKEKTQAA